MSETRPSTATLYVGQAMANQVLFKLALSMATNFAHTTPAERTADGGELLRQTLEAFAVAAEFDETVAGLDSGSYDSDVAKQMATDALDEALTMIRTRVLGMPE